MAETIRVLVTDTAPLTPVRWGGPHRIYHLYSNLPKRFEVTYVGLDLNAKESREIKVNNRLREIIVPPTKMFPLVRRAQMLLLREESIDLYSYLFAHRDAPYRDALLREAEQCDILIASHPWGYPVLREARDRARREGKRKSLVYDAHNCEHALNRQILSASPRVLRAPILWELSAIEDAACRGSDLVLACAPRDRDNLARQYGLDPARITLLPNPVPLRPPRTARRKNLARSKLGMTPHELVALFIGAYYRPNIEALEIILRLATELPRVRFHICGSISRYPEFSPHPQPIPENVVMHGIVDENTLDELLAAADIALNPNLSGEGIQIKMLDYLAAGVPVLSTPHGCRGLPVRSEEHLFIADLPVFSSALKGLISKRASEKNRLTRVAENGRKVVAAHYDSAVLGKILGGYLSNLMARDDQQDGDRTRP